MMSAPPGARRMQEVIFPHPLRLYGVWCIACRIWQVH